MGGYIMSDQIVSSLGIEESTSSPSPSFLPNSHYFNNTEDVVQTKLKHFST